MHRQLAHNRTQTKLKIPQNWMQEHFLSLLCVFFSSNAFLMNLRWLCRKQDINFAVWCGNRKKQRNGKNAVYFLSFKFNYTNWIFLIQIPLHNERMVIVWVWKNRAVPPSSQLWGDPWRDFFLCAENTENIPLLYKFFSVFAKGKKTIKYLNWKSKRSKKNQLN